MAFPAGLTLVTVAIKLDLPPSGGATGTVRFSSPAALVGASDNSIVPPFTVTVSLAADGSAAVQLPATNDPDWTPQDWAYAVRVQAGTQDFRGTLQLDHLAPSVQLADLLQVDGAATPGVTYATLAQLTAASDNLTADIDTVADDVTSLTASVFRASDHGLVAWSFDPANIQGGTILPTAGLLQVVRVRTLSPVATSIEMYVTAGGTSLTSGQCFAAVFNGAGALLGAGAVTGSAHGTGVAGWGDAGRKSLPLSVAQAVVPNADYLVGFYANTAGTLPTFARAANVVDGSALNLGMSAPTLRFSSANAGLTTTMPANVGAQTAIGTAWMVGIR